MKKYFAFFLFLVFSICNAQDIRIENKELKDSSVKLRYHTSAIYPQLTGMKNEGIQKKVNKEIQETVSKGINEFKKDMSEWDLSSIPAEFNSEIEYSYTSYVLNEDVFSFALEIYSYYAGAAHPNHWSKSMNFDLKTGINIPLKNLFVPGAKYLDKISKYCISDIKFQGGQIGYEPDEMMLNEGAGANDSNFLNYNLLQKGLQITFDPYQVGPYALGTQYVFIPYIILNEMINAEGVLKKFDY